MSDPPYVPDRAGPVTVIYILYLVGLVVGITHLIAVVMAYLYQSDAPMWAATHHRFQIRTFWIGLLYGLIGVALAFVISGFAVFAFVVVWLIVRCVKGMKFAAEGRPYPNPSSWLW
jgi:uncharacterized membrane protein